MKKILLLITFVLISLVTFAQTEYPYIKEENGKKVVILTYDQANNLINKAELLNIYKTYFKDKNQYDSLTVKIIEEQKKVIYQQDLTIADYKKIISSKDERIAILNNQIELYQKFPNVETIKIEDETTKKKLKYSRLINGALLIAVVILLF
jgi:hypothetical protein